jgi:hypothetical protein
MHRGGLNFHATKYHFECHSLSRCLRAVARRAALKITAPAERAGAVTARVPRPGKSVTRDECPSNHLVPKPAGSRRRVSLATSGTFAAFVGCHASGGTGKPAVAYEAARSHARAAFLCLRLPCAPRRYRANSEYTPRRLRERRFSTPSGFARLSRQMQEYATRFQLSSSTCASLREASQRPRRGPLSSIRLIQAEKVDGDWQSFPFPIQRNRDRISTRKIDVRMMKRSSRNFGSR